MSLDPSDILGNFFKFLSQSGSSTAEYSRPPFYLDSSTNLLQNVNGGPGTYSYQGYGNNNSGEQWNGNDIVKYGQITFACILLLVVASILILCVVCCTMCCCEGDEQQQQHQRKNRPSQQQQQARVTVVEYAPKISVTNINMERRSALPSAAVYVRPFLE